MIRYTGVVIILSFTSAACASRSFDRHFAEGRYAAAAAAFSADPALNENDGVLFRAAVIHAAPDLGAYDPHLARELFVRLLERHPHSTHRQAATRYVALIDEIERVRYAAIEKQQRLEAERARLELDVARLRTQVDALQAKLLARDQQNVDLRNAVERLGSTLKDRQLQLDVLKTELDRLKAIDLRVPPAPGDPRGTGLPPGLGRGS